MNLNLTMPVKASLGASAAAGTSLAAAGAGGAFSSGTQLEKVEGDKEDLVEVNNQEQSPNVTDISSVEDVQESIPKDGFYPEDNFDKLKTDSNKTVRFISQDENQKYEEGTIGQKYSRFLIAVNSDEQYGNKEWWNKQFEKYGKYWKKEQIRSEDNPFNKTQEAKSGYDQNLSKTSLNGLCHEVYQLTKTNEEIKQQPSAEPRNPGVDTFSIWEDFWMFCSPEKIDPLFIEANNSSFGSQPTNNLISFEFKSQLLSTLEELKEVESKEQKEIKNEFIWKKLNYHFFTTEDVKDPYFKFFKDENLSNYSTNERILLKDKCDEAYKIQTTVSVGANRPSDAALLKYCSLGD